MKLNKEMKIYILCFLVVAGFALAVGFHYYYYYYRHQGYPFSTFLFLPKVHTSDFYDVLREGRFLDPYLTNKSAQYPFLVLLGYLFSLIPQHQYYFYVGIVSGLFLLFSIINLWLGKWYLNLTPIFSITFLSYPFLFTLDRGNFEGLLFVFLLAFIFFYSKKQYLVSAAFLSVAIATKVFPAILLVLFIPPKKYREMIICVAITLTITIISLLCFKGGFSANLNYLLAGVNISSNTNFDRFTGIESNVVQRGVSLLTLVKIFHYETGLLPRFFQVNFSNVYTVLVVTLAILTVVYIIFIEKEIWKKTALLIFAILLFPPISAEYKLLHVFIPLYIFINCQNSSKSDLPYLLMFGLLLIPKDYYFFQGVISENGIKEISISVVINMLTMIFMALAIVTSGLIKWNREINDPSSGATSK